MKAVVLREYGKPEKLSYEDVVDPVAGEGQVLVRVTSASVNPVDYKLRSGAYKDFMPLTFPAIGKELGINPSRAYHNGKAITLIPPASVDAIASPRPGAITSPDDAGSRASSFVEGLDD